MDPQDLDAVIRDDNEHGDHDTWVGPGWSDRTPLVVDIDSRQAFAMR